MTPRAARRLHAVAEALRTLAGGALLTGGLLALCWLVELVTIR